MTKRFSLTTADPRFSPRKLITVNGYTYQPVTGVSASADRAAGLRPQTATQSSQSSIPDADAIQAVRDLIILHCEHDPEWHCRGAQALRTINQALLTKGCGVTHQGQPVFCDDERLPDSCRWYFCRCKRDAAAIVEAIQE